MSKTNPCQYPIHWVIEDGPQQPKLLNVEAFSLLRREGGAASYRTAPMSVYCTAAAIFSAASGVTHLVQMVLVFLQEVLGAVFALA